MFVNLPVKRISWLTISAVLSIILGYIGFKVLPEVVVKIIQKRIKLDPSSPVFELWRDAPVDIYHRFYFFDITNPIEIEREGQKPRLKEIGPFVYNIKMKKVPVIDNNNDTVSYRELKQWHFNSELSPYDEDFVITTINAPLISALNFIQRAPQPLRTWISITLDTITEGIFIRRSIKQLTFYGYPDILVSIGTLIDPRTPNTDGRFAYLAQKNNTADAEYTVFSGQTNQHKLGLVEKVDGLNYIPKWKEYPCRNLNDVYTGQIMYSPLNVPRANIQMFNDLFGRKMNLKYRATVESYPGIKSYRYTFDENNFKNAIDYPPNACYTSRMPKAMYDAYTLNATGPNSNALPPVERQSSPGSLLLNLARRRFENSNSPLANLFNRNILSRPMVGDRSNDGSSQQPTTTAQPTTTTTTSTASPELLSNYETPANEEEGTSAAAVDDFDTNSSRTNLAESLVMTTTDSNTIDHPMHSQNSLHQQTTKATTTTSTTTTTVASIPTVRIATPSPKEHHHPAHWVDASSPQDANLFGRAIVPGGNSESRQDQFSSSLSNLFSNRVGESPLLSLFAPRESNGSPDNSGLDGRLFNRNGNNVLGNLISNGLNRLLSLRNARRLEAENSSNGESNKMNSEPNRTILSRSVRNALRRVTRNTGPALSSKNLTLSNSDQNSNSKTTLLDYIALRKQNMFPSGAFDFSEIAFGAPIFLSQPHFLNADSYYNDRLIGMKPNKEKHDFFVDVEPMAGSSIKTAIRLQINVALLKSPNIFRFRNFKENIFPVFWQEIDMSLPDNFQSMIRMVGAAPNAVSEIVFCVLLIVGLALFTGAVFVFARARTTKLPDLSIENETIAALNGRSVDKHPASTVGTNLAYSTSLNNNNNNLSTFDKHNSKVIFTMVPSYDDSQKPKPN